MSLIKVGTIQGQTAGTDIQVPTGHKIQGVDTGSIYAPGHVIQVVQRTSTSHETISAGSWTATNAYATITPKFSTSKILVQVTGTLRAYNNGGADARGAWRLYKDIDGGGYNRVGTHQLTQRAYDYGSSGLIIDHPFHVQYLDSPGTTSALTYKLYGYKEAGTAIEIGPDGDDEQYVTLMEIAQ